jgi:hypothetical protein
MNPQMMSLPGQQQQMPYAKPKIPYRAIFVSVIFVVGVFIIIAHIQQFRNASQQINMYSAEFIHHAETVSRRLIELLKTPSPTTDTLAQYRQLLRGTEMFVALHVMSSLAKVDLSRGETYLINKITNSRPLKTKTNNNNDKNGISEGSKTTAISAGLRTTQPSVLHNNSGRKRASKRIHFSQEEINEQQQRKNTTPTYYANGIDETSSMITTTPTSTSPPHSIPFHEQQQQQQQQHTDRALTSYRPMVVAT